MTIPATKNTATPSPRTQSRESWIRVGTELLATGGLNAIRVEALARRLGVTKGSFYWHFKNRGDLIDAILQDWQHRQTQAVIEQVEQAGGDAGTRLEQLWKVAGAETDNGAELALRDEARRDANIAAFLRRVDEQRMGYLRLLFTDLGHDPLEAEARSLLAYSLLIGNHFIDVAHAIANRKTVLKNCRSLLFEPPPKPNGASPKPIELG